MNNTKTTIALLLLGAVPLVGPVAFGLAWNVALAASCSIVLTALLKHVLHWTSPPNGIRDSPDR